MPTYLLKIILIISFLATALIPERTYAMEPDTRAISTSEDQEGIIYPHKVIFKESSLIPVVKKRSTPGIINLLNEMNDNQGIDIVKLCRRGRHSTPSIVEQLSIQDLKHLLKFLAKHQIQIQWLDEDGHNRSGKVPFKLKRFVPSWDKTNGAAALVFVIAAKISDHTHLIARILAMAPEEILSGLKRQGYSVLTTEAASQAIMIMADFIQIREWSPQEAGMDNIKIVQNIARLGHEYARYWAKKNPKKIEEYLQRIVYRSRVVSKGPEKDGVMLGSILSGIYKVVHEIKEIDVKRIFILLMLSNTISGLASFLGIIGLIPGTVILTSVLQGIIRTAAAVLPQIYVRKCGSPRDFAPIVRAFAGKIEMSVLMLETDQNRHQIQTMLSWMRCTMNLNGFAL